MKHAHLLKDPKLPKANFAPIKLVLGDLMPGLMPGPRGRHRLVLALAQRFGENFRMNTDAQRVLGHFDSETHKIALYLRSKGAQHHG